MNINRTFSFLLCYVVWWGVCVGVCCGCGGTGGGRETDVVRGPPKEVVHSNTRLRPPSTAATAAAAAAGAAAAGSVLVKRRTQVLSNKNL
jgi:hypothetical protein